ncbi:MAG: sigma-54 dependent transcriptional regulator, partial [Myxococcota bacterium]
EHLRIAASQSFELAGIGAECFCDAPSVLRRLNADFDGVLVTDIHMPGMDGLEVLARLKTTHPRLPVLVLTADGVVESVIRATRLGAYDYLTKPVARAKLLTDLRNATVHGRLSTRVAQLEREAQERDGFAGMVGRSEPMRHLFRAIDRVAVCDVTALIQGPSGAGKERVAQAIHQHSGRSQGPFVALNCAAIPESLQESELFGHERGAFTGAAQRRMGRFEQADGGTLFLDEVAELSLPLQAKLLRVLQERTFHRVGGERPVTSDFRLLAATHRDLAREVRSGRFRGDLFFRIAVFEVVVPPLHARGEDIVLLAQRFVDHFAEQQHHPHPRPKLGADTIEALHGYDWPGNVRELQNAIQHALVVCDGPVITVDHLPERLSPAVHLAELEPTAVQGSSKPSGELLPVVPLHELERMALAQALARTRGNVSEVGRQLEISRTTLYRKLKRYGLRP